MGEETDTKETNITEVTTVKQSLEQAFKHLDTKGGGIVGPSGKLIFGDKAKEYLLERVKAGADIGKMVKNSKTTIGNVGDTNTNSLEPENKIISSDNNNASVKTKTEDTEDVYDPAKNDISTKLRAAITPRNALKDAAQGLLAVERANAIRRLSRQERTGDAFMADLAESFTQNTDRPSAQVSPAFRPATDFGDRAVQSSTLASNKDASKLGWAKLAELGRANKVGEKALFRKIDNEAQSLKKEAVALQLNGKLTRAELILKERQIDILADELKSEVITNKSKLKQSDEKLKIEWAKINKKGGFSNELKLKIIQAVNAEDDPKLKADIIRQFSGN